MIHALITGTVFTPFQAKTSSSGKHYAMGKLRVPQADGEPALFVNCVCFDKTTMPQLVELGQNNAVSVVGTMKVNIWTPENGEPRINCNLVIDQCLTVHHVKRKQQVMQPAQQQPASLALLRATHNAQMPLHEMPDDEV